MDPPLPPYESKSLVNTLVDYHGFGCLSFAFDAPRRLFASNCISLGGGAFSLGAGAGLPTRPGVLDLAFDLVLVLMLVVGPSVSYLLSASS